MRLGSYQIQTAGPAGNIPTIFALLPVTPNKNVNEFTMVAVAGLLGKLAATIPDVCYKENCVQQANNTMHIPDCTLLLLGWN